MFAFAIWDKRNNYYSARQRSVWRKAALLFPQYYAACFFGSEMKSILKGKFSSKELDWQAVDSYFSYGYILSPLSIYKDIRKLPPGHILIVKAVNNQFTGSITQYWKPEFKSDNSLSFDDYKVLIREQLDDTVKAHLVSDVPVGA